MLEVSDLHAYYGKSHILQGVNFNVGSGEIVSLLGRNGVGRSTTCKAIIGEVAPHWIVSSSWAKRSGRYARPYEIANHGHRLRARKPRYLSPASPLRQNLTARA